MAQSRLEKIGTIFSRVAGLLKSGAMKVEDKPLWYNVYAAFPPKLDPKFDRRAPNIPIRKIFYEEDVIRAHFHKLTKGKENMNLKDEKNNTKCQQFIEIYSNLKSQGALDDEKIKEIAYDMLKDKLKDPETNENFIEESTLRDSTKKQTHTLNVKDIFKD